MKPTLNFIVFLFISMAWAQQPIGKTQQIKETTSHALKCVSGNCQDGWGKWEFDNGYYEGFWMNGKREGYGLYKWDEFGSYVGFWINDKMEGYGSYEDQNKKIMSGMYTNGMLNGLGEESTKDNEFARGVYKDHKLQTPYTFISNSIDTGCTAGDCKDSYGRYVWDNGDFFSGYFKSGMPFLGRYEFANGDIYQGMFNVNGQFHGQGRFFYIDGGYFGGNFYNGNFNGRGYYHDKDYTTKIGVWDNGTLVKAF